jgi:hypothetical protein
LAGGHRLPTGPPAPPDPFPFPGPCPCVRRHLHLGVISPSHRPAYARMYANLSPSSLWYRTVGTHCRVPHQGASPTSRKTHGAHPTSYDRFSGQSLLVLPPSTSILAQPPRLRPSRHPRSLVLAIRIDLVYACPCGIHGVQPILRGRCSLLRDHARLLGLSTVRVQQSPAEKIMAPPPNLGMFARPLSL